MLGYYVRVAVAVSNLNSKKDPQTPVRPQYARPMAMAHNWQNVGVTVTSHCPQVGGRGRRRSI